MSDYYLVRLLSVQFISRKYLLTYLPKKTGCNDNIPFFHFHEFWSNHICVRKITFALSVIYVQLFVCLSGFGMLLLAQDQISRRFFLISIWRIFPAKFCLDLTNLFATLRAVAIWRNIQPNGKYCTWRLRRCRWFWFNFCHFNFSWAVFTSFDLSWSGNFVEHQVFVYFLHSTFLQF